MRFTSKRPFFIAGLLLILAMTVVAFSLRHQAPQTESVPSTYLRIPEPDQRHAFRGFEAVQHPLSEELHLPLPPHTRQSLIEIGVVRTKGDSAISPTLRFQAFSPGWFGEKKILDVEQELALNRVATYRLDGAAAGRFGSTRKITLKLLEPDGAEDDLSEDEYAFLVPTVFSKRGPDEMNVLLISFDTLRPDHLSSYGYPRPTSPNIDRLAAKGVRFTEAISTAPWTMPAHYSAFTGLYPSAHQNRWQSLEAFESDSTLAKALRGNQYYTHAITGGGSVSSRWGMGIGFNMYREFVSYSNTDSPERSWKHEDDTGKTFGTAIEWLEANSHLKFFLFLHHFECHDPYENKTFLGDADPSVLIEQRKALYDGDIRHADSFLGDLMESVDRLGLLENTIIVFFSDHGDDFYDHYKESDLFPEPTGETIPEISVVDHAHSLYEELVRVPLIFYVPGLDAPIKVIHNQVSLVDIMPTILDFVGVGSPDPLQGVSLSKLLVTGKRAKDPPAFSEFTINGPERKAIRFAGHKYIWTPNPDDKGKEPYPKSVDQFEFFNLEEDPDESSNRYDDNQDMALAFHNMLVEQLRSSREIARSLGRDWSGEQRNIDLDNLQGVEEDILDSLRALGYLE